jgi:hypothetical protein
VHASESDEHDRVIHIVFGEVIDGRLLSQQVIALVEIDVDHQRVWFAGGMSRQAGEHPAADFDGRRPPSRALLGVRESQRDLAYGIERRRASHE